MSAKTPTHAALLAVAEEAARTAGQHALSNRSRRRETVTRFAHDVKLRLDIESQDVAERVIRSHFPEHAFLAEEQEHAPESTPAGDAYEWIVDPIDGTVNFTHGSPHWCCSVAVRRGEEVLAGAVFAPVSERCYLASRGGGASCNGEPIGVSDVAEVSEAMVRTGLDQKVNTGQVPYAILTRLADGVQKIRVVGSAALDICRVAEGASDGYYESGIFLWDVAAAALIAEEAGGRCEVLGRPPAPHALNFLATNGHVHDALRNLICEA